MIVYYPLWLYLRCYGMNRTRLLNCISSAILAKLGKNENVDVETINKICAYLDCQPSDIMEFRPDL